MQNISFFRSGKYMWGNDYNARIQYTVSVIESTGVTYSFFPHTPRKNEYIPKFPPGKMRIY